MKEKSILEIYWTKRYVHLFLFFFITCFPYLKPIKKVLDLWKLPTFIFYAFIFFVMFLSQFDYFWKCLIVSFYIIILNFADSLTLEIMHGIERKWILYYRFREIVADKFGCTSPNKRRCFTPFFTIFLIDHYLNILLEIINYK